MYSKVQKDQQATNVIHFRPKRAAFVLPRDPNGEELAFDWTLSETDKSTVLQRRGDDNRRRYAVQLCVLRKYGRFLDNYRRVPARVIGYLSRQLEIEPSLSLTAASREATEAGYRDDIRRYLGYSQFDETKKQHLERWVLAAVSESFYVEDLIENTEKHLKNLKIVIPPSGHLVRIVNSVYAKAERTIFQKITARLPAMVKQNIDDLLKTDRASGQTRFFQLGEYPPEAKARKIAQYFCKYKDLSATRL